MQLLRIVPTNNRTSQNDEMFRCAGLSVSGARTYLSCKTWQVSKLSSQLNGPPGLSSDRFCLHVHAYILQGHFPHRALRKGAVSLGRGMCEGSFQANIQLCLPPVSTGCGCAPSPWRSLSVPCSCCPSPSSAMKSCCPFHKTITSSGWMAPLSTVSSPKLALCK